MRFRPPRFPGEAPSPHPLWLVAVLLAGVVPFGSAAQTGVSTAEARTGATGWVCGVIVDEVLAFVAEAELTLYPRAEAGASEPEPVAQATSDAHGAFCLQDLPPGFYQLRVAKEPWPTQPARTVEVRAGLLNRLTPIELEWEPGEPRVSYEESLDHMPAGQARALVERLLQQGDPASIRELTRRLLPKRGVRIDIGRLVQGMDPRPLVDELIRQLESGYLPPLKTARYIYIVGQLVDQRTHDAAMNLFLRKLRDGRRLPPRLAAADGRGSYVSDVAVQALARLTGKDFGWKYGEPPLQNQSAIRGAQSWWRQELDRRSRDRR